MMARAEEPRTPDEVFIAAVPENTIPELKEILAKAMANAPRVISAGLDYEQAQIGVKQARAPMLPSVYLSGSFGLANNRYDYENYPVLDSNGNAQLDANGVPRQNPGYTTQYTVMDLSYNGGISQPVFRWGALKKGYQSAQLQRAISERNLSEARRLIALDVRRTYFNLILASSAAEAERAALARMEKEWEFLKQQAADGFVTASIASSMETQIIAYKLQMRRGETARDTQWRDFRQLAGLDSAADIPLPKEIPAVPTSVGERLASIEDQPNGLTPTSLLNAEDSIRSERLNFEIQKTRLKPHFGVSLNASRGIHSPDAAVSSGSPYTLTSYGASTTVSWNIFDGFSTQAAKQSSLIRLRQLKDSRDQVERTHRENLKSYVNSLRLNWDSLKTTEKNLSDYRSDVETYQKDYEAGFIPKKVWDAAKIAADNALSAANSARASYYMDIVNYLSLRGKDPALNLAERKKSRP